MKFFASFLLVSISLICSLSAQDKFQAAPAVLQVPDVQVVTQTGDHLRFNSQLVKGRIAIVTGFFTVCTSMCPITQENLSRLARLLGSRLGKDVIIISLSVDPVNDTPERMKDWGEKFHIGPGWVLASGNKADVQTLLKSLGLFVDLPQRHQSALMVGGETSGWVRVSSWTSPEKLVKLVDEISQAKPVLQAGPVSAHRFLERLQIVDWERFFAFSGLAAPLSGHCATCISKHLQESSGIWNKTPIYLNSLILGLRVVALRPLPDPPRLKSHANRVDSPTPAGTGRGTFHAPGMFNPELPI